MSGSLLSRLLRALGIAELLVGRFLLGAFLLAVTAGVVGTGDLVTLLVGCLWVVSAGTAILVVQTDAVGYYGSVLEVLAQLGQVLVAGYGVFTDPSALPVIAFFATGVGILVLVGATIPRYGELFVAP